VKSSIYIEIFVTVLAQIATTVTLMDKIKMEFIH